jgi:hypothetical protein
MYNNTMIRRWRIPIALFIIISVVVFALVIYNKTNQSLTILSVTSGKVFVLKPNSAIWLEGKEGMTLDVDYVVKSEAAAQATITFFEGSTVELEGSTEIKLAELGNIARNERNSIMLIQEIGKTTSRIKKLIDPVSRYEIETKAAVAAVRGSTMYVDVAEYGRTAVGNAEGVVSIIAQGVEVKIPEGMHSSALPGQEPSDPLPGVKAVSISSTLNVDPLNDLFDKNGNRTQNEGYLDIVRSQIFFSDRQYTARIELNGKLPNQTDLPSSFIEWDLLVDSDRNPGTGLRWPLIGNDIGYDYLIRVSLKDAKWEPIILVTSTNARHTIPYSVKDNIVELYFPMEAIDDSSNFNWIVAVRKYRGADLPNEPSFSDKAPDKGHYSFSSQETSSS